MNASGIRCIIVLDHKDIREYMSKLGNYLRECTGAFAWSPLLVMTREVLSACHFVYCLEAAGTGI